ncbi:MAG: polyprenyl synthetase family protein [bacterium]
MGNSWRKEEFESYLYHSIEKEINDTKWKEQIMYSLKAGGKRFRPALCYKCGKALSLEQEPLYLIGSSIELLHTASLIHDDLPEIDNDDYRRGQLSHHKQFDHGTAVIAGDFLFFLAFDLITRLNHLDLTKYFIQCSKDLAYGEYLDITIEAEQSETQRALLKMYDYKTARLIEFSMTAPSIFKNKTKQHHQILKKAGQKMGIAFQILDDLKGIERTFEEIGKTPGKDLINEKKTILSLLGIEASKQLVIQKKQECISELNSVKTIDGTDYDNVIHYLNMIWQEIATA